MSKRKFRADLRTHLIEKFSEIEHPVDPSDTARFLPLRNAAAVTDALLALLRLPSTAVDAAQLEKQILNAFRDCLEAGPLETDRKVEAVGRLARRLEEFAQKVYAIRHPTQNVPGGFAKLLKTDVVGYQGRLEYKPTYEKMRDVLLSQSTGQAVIHDAYYVRNTLTHKSKTLKTIQEQRYLSSVVSTYLLIAQRNIDLVPKIRKRAEQAERMRSGLPVCLQRVQQRFDALKWRNEYYIELSTTDGHELEDHVTDFLESPTRRLLPISGRTGAGKSTYLERLVEEYAAAALNILGDEIQEGLIVPAYLDLKRYIPSKRNYLVKKLYNELDPDSRLGIKTRRVEAWPKKLMPLCLLVCLDGLDEVAEEAWPGVVSEIDDLAAGFDNLKVIVASRPHAIPDHWDDSLITILPVPRDEVIEYFSHPERLSLLTDDVQAFLESRPEIVDILKDPLMLEAAGRYWRQFELVAESSELDPESSELDPELRQEALMVGPLLQHLYRAFFTHHARRAFSRKQMSLEKARQVNALAQLALEMDGDPLASDDVIARAWARWEFAEKSIKDLLDLFVDIGLLEVQENEFSFRNDTSKAYFGAVGLRGLTRRTQDVEIALSYIRYATTFWDRCVALLKEIAPFCDTEAIEEHLASLAGA